MPDDLHSWARETVAWLATLPSLDDPTHLLQRFGGDLAPDSDRSTPHRREQVLTGAALPTGVEVRLVDARSWALLTFTLPAPPPRLALADVSDVMPGLPRFRPEHASFPGGPRIVATTQAWTVPAGELWFRCEEPSKRLAIIGLSSGR